MEKNNSDHKSMVLWMLIMALVIAGGVAYFQFSKSDYDRGQYTDNTPTNASKWINNTAEVVPQIDSVPTDANANAVIKKETGYQDYSEPLVRSALEEGQKVAIFFHASWCPNCRALENAIKANLSQIPENTLIVKADYDNETALKQKYGVTIQTTVVILKSDGSLEKKIIGPSSIDEILK